MKWGVLSVLSASRLRLSQHFPFLSRVKGHDRASPMYDEANYRRLFNTCPVNLEENLMARIHNRCQIKLRGLD